LGDSVETVVVDQLLPLKAALREDVLHVASEIAKRVFTY